MSFKHRLSIGFTVMLLLLLVQGVFSGWLFRESRDLGELVKREELPLVLETMALRQQLHQVHGALQGWILTQDATFKSEYHFLWESIRGNATLTQDSRLKQQTAALQNLQDEVVLLAHTLESQPAARLMTQKIEPAVDEIQAVIQRLLFLERDRNAQQDNLLQLKQSKILLYTLSNFQHSFSEVYAELNAVLISGKGDGLDYLGNYWGENEAAWQGLERSNLMPEQQEQMERIRTLRGQFLLDAKEMVQLRGSEQWNLASWKVKSEVAPMLAMVIESVNQLVVQRTEHMNRGFTQQSEVMNKGSRMVWIFLAIAFLVMSITARAVAQGVRKPIQQVQRVFQDIHDKNYHTPIEIESEDEMGMLLESLKGMRQQLLDAEMEEQAHRSALQNQKFALDQAAIVSATDLDGTISYVNQQMLELTGYKEEELLGQNHRILRSDVHDVDFYENMWKTIVAGLVWRGEICNLTKTGGKVWLETVIVPFLGEDLIPVHYMAIRYDITLIKESEQRIREEQERTVCANQELQESMEELQETQQQLVESEKMAALGGLVAGVAHEVNTPLGISVTAASYLKDQTNVIVQHYRDQKMKRSELERYMAQAEESSTIVLENLMRASALVKSFKQVAVDQSSEELRLFLVVEYLEDILRSLRPKLKQLPHQVMITGDPEIEMVGDPGVLAQVITNLVMNAVIHGLDDAVAGEIKMDVHEQDESVVIQFKDNGKGAPPSVVDNIFEPFFTTRRGAGGSGLGMHLVYNLLSQKMGGTIHCSSEIGKGMLFTLTLPKHPSNTPSMDTSDSSDLLEEQV
ncbi:MAG: PAS domain S-box protein [Gammaproteobacteria bacterium]|nr:PAS domain S-box protein [Gammaproteobacteria bacterium]MBT4607280.1 PAS domain S-box protein [Thiotrichales bacterium]MBT3473875.1 PAS domain S-box protein [Gammaproteobacteria bacterium]MBT3892559.1 PAS domain S-box protein [Gammaproteobacteria bacterium]MBT3966175.1 PAS domain S-box protein [Gammaproteobacteria bacterium]